MTKVQVEVVWEMTDVIQVMADKHKVGEEVTMEFTKKFSGTVWW